MTTKKTPSTLKKTSLKKPATKRSVKAKKRSTSKRSLLKRFSAATLTRRKATSAKKTAKRIPAKKPSVTSRGFLLSKLDFKLTMFLLAFAVVGTIGIYLVHAAATSFDVIAAEDTYVSSRQTGTNFGDSSVLKVSEQNGKCSNNKSCIKNDTSRTYMKFNVNAIPSGHNVKSVSLKMYVTNASPDGGALYTVTSNSWNEMTVNWNTKPANTTTPLASFGAVTAGQWKTITLPASSIAANGTYSFALVSANQDDAQYGSRTSANKPTLTITTEPVQTNPVATTTVNDSAAGTGNNQFEFIGPWTADADASANGGDEHWTKDTTSAYQVRFSGTGAKIYTTTDPYHGIMAVSLDGGAETMVDTYSSTRQHQIMVYTSPTVGSGNHILKVRVTGTKSASSLDSYIVADKVDVIADTTAAPTPTTSITINDNETGTLSNQVEYTGAWNYGGDPLALNGDEHYTTVAGYTYQVRFSGVGAKLYNTGSIDHGIMAVSIDGGAETMVDMYRPARTNNILSYSSPALSNGAHTLKVRVTSNKNVKSTGTYIAADRIDVLSSIDGTATWTKCADENGTCVFSGTKTVRYGAQGVYATKIFTDSVQCTSAVFGDPIPGTPKICEVAGATSPTPTPLPTGTPQPVGVGGVWKPLFADEFNGTTLDMTKWNDTCTYPAAPGWYGCNTAQGTVSYYVPRYATGHAFGEPYQEEISNGFLRLIATKRDPGVGTACGGVQCTWASARVQTGPEYDGQPNRFEMKYGYIEGRMKVPHGKGLWPSFWLTGSGGAEIDIFEFLAGNTKRIMQTNHGWNSVGGSLEEYYSPDGVDFGDGQWHVFGLDWQPDHIAWYVDGKLARSVITDPAVIPPVAQKIFIDNPVGTEWGANGVPDGGGAPDATTPSPSNFDIDYVRVWQK